MNTKDMEQSVLSEMDNKKHFKTMNKRIGFRHFDQFQKFHQEKLARSGTGRRSESRLNIRRNKIFKKSNSGM